MFFFSHSTDASWSLHQYEVMRPSRTWTAKHVFIPQCSAAKWSPFQKHCRCAYENRSCSRTTVREQLLFSCSFLKTDHKAVFEGQGVYVDIQLGNGSWSAHISGRGNSLNNAAVWTFLPPHTLLFVSHCFLSFFALFVVPVSVALLLATYICSYCCTGMRKYLKNRKFHVWKRSASFSKFRSSFRFWRTGERETKAKFGFVNPF